MSNGSDCLFCQMVGGSFPVEMLHQDDLVFAVNDIAPRAPTHVLIVPRQHIESVRRLDAAEHSHLLGHMIATANKLADSLDLGERGFRLTFNVGEEGGQTIYHLHLHLLGGKHLGPEA